MTKEYLKMADVFIGDVVAGDDDLIRDDDGLIGDMQWPSDCVKYAAHAINSHDELVAEVERLRGELSAAENVLDEVDRVVTERIKNGAYDLDGISAEVSQAIERINRDVD